MLVGVTTQQTPLSLAADLATAFRGHPAGVAVLTALGPADESGRRVPVGLTVSSLASVSVEPAVISVSLDNRSETLAALGEGSRVVVHMLDADRVDLADTFAVPGADHFVDVAWTLTPEGAPLLDVRGPVLHGRVGHMLDVGAASLLVVVIDRIEVGRRDGDALVRMGRAWHPVPRAKQA